jgi:malonyl-CoA/methylmalonyl-CoA synthetase
MRLYVSGSAPLSPETFTRFEKVFSHKILERYGMSEASMITSNLYEGSGARKQGTVGKPMPGIRVRLNDNGSIITKSGKTGEIQIKGPNVFEGYWQALEKTKESFADGWFKSGDIGKWDETGNLIICGRAKELIISRGFNIYPQEIVNCMCTHPKINEAAVLGEPDKIHGERIKAVIVPSGEGVSEEDVIEYCKAHLASFKVPKKVVFRDKLPRNAIGKILVKAL